MGPPTSLVIKMHESPITIAIAGTNLNTLLAYSLRMTSGVILLSFNIWKVLTMPEQMRKMSSAK